jgi:PBP1b-binding outer membrane lipoprotein LpoB
MRISDMKAIHFHAAILAALILAGCSTEKPHVKYVDPNTPGSMGGTGLESQDISAAAQKAAQSIVNLPQIAQATTPPTILITPVSNHSSTPIDTDLYTTKLRGILMQYNSSKVRFLARDASWNINNNEQAMRQRGEVVPGAARQAATYNYILTAELRGISSSSEMGRSEYFLVAFKLVDFNDVLLWENQYEIKKQGNDHTIYR